MTTNRIILAAVLGGLAMFIWTFIAHDILPLGHVGIGEIPKEEPVLAAMQSGIDKSGLYLFPGFGLSDNPTREQRKEAMEHMAEKYARNPSGLLMYHPPGRPLNIGKLLSVEFGTELIEVFLILLLLSRTQIDSYGSRVGFILVGGILAALATNVSYWNWYGFPGSYTISYMTIQIVGFLCAGLVAALVLRKKPAAT